jgi:hypothetical protein
MLRNQCLTLSFLNTVNTGPVFLMPLPPRYFKLEIKCKICPLYFNFIMGALLISLLSNLLSNKPPVDALIWWHCRYF